MALHFLRTFDSPIRKNLNSTGKSDLSLIWAQAASPVKSPRSKFTTDGEKEAINILSILESSKPSTPKKKLFCPPSMIQSPSQKCSSSSSLNHEDDENQDLLFSRFSITTEKKFELPSEFQNLVTFVFKGPENQNEAWENFKRIAKSVKCGLVACATYAFIFSEGKVHAKAFTGTAQKKLEENSDKLPEFDFDKALDMIDQNQSSEKLSIYSTDQFYYSVVTPFVYNFSEFNSSSGTRYRISVSGYIFAFHIEKFMKMRKNYDSFKTSKSILHQLKYGKNMK
ncbi:hypothetical protein TRFO_07756 [Tritrichomonas foetus]|uniref:Uncharacterized protein n=1 Tax=Tritrichomonas foetus TaxID=1144522 RepID=A0A1J4JPU5_9EUKA|nr:hypothetical protein TRFO_07756 [Tritrichomonas foetus]|eukprot:OHT00778.1 hypothetical protein TRFO_07756 [Tritrichomonas foetus]